jgi:diaminopimelate decarboxylase
METPPLAPAATSANIVPPTDEESNRNRNSNSNSESPSACPSNDPTSQTTSPAAATSLSTPSASTTSIPSHRTKRASAKEQMAQTWHNRRLARQQQHQSDARASVSSATSTTRSSSATTAIPADSIRRSDVSANTKPSGLSQSICFLLRTSWEKAVADLKSTRKHETKSSKNDTPEVAAAPPPKKSSSSGSLSGGTFPSVLPILQATALLHHVEFFNSHAEDDDDVGDNEDDIITSDATHSEPPGDGTHRPGGSSQHQQQQQLPQLGEEHQRILSILPAGYNWNQAVWQMTQARSRAFLLLDLAALVHRLVEWQRRYTSASTITTTTTTVNNSNSNSNSNDHGKIQFLYQVRANANVKLLQLLIRSNVGLVTTTKGDVDRCLAAAAASVPVSLASAAAATAMASHMSTVKPPNSVAAPIVWDNAAVTGKPDGYLRKLVACSTAAARRGSTTTISTTVAVDGPEDVERVHSTVQRILKRARQRRQLGETDNDQQCHVLYYILRLDNGQHDTWKTSLESTLKSILATDGESRLVGLSFDLAENDSKDSNLADRLQAMEDLLDGLTPNDSGLAATLRIDLTGLATAPFPDSLVLWWDRLVKRTMIHQVTVDVTRMLVAPAGALCTRIIGVKREETDAGNIRQHYYIDDGCYGSLYQAGMGDSSFLPMPLLSRPSSAERSEAPSADLHLSTVWGPTCDGLDRVCRDIPLPCLQRDDWLVFPNLGCSGSEGLGTAFNGFDPPDTVYCVLGYFR